ncbi:DcrB-related protein [Caballeronia sp. NK8]|uniref:DcrB-related protein n=1 Tax=Caballeronia sp. NK8 TaxID=140098 RepID=UPI001BCD76FA|nr:DUF1795 domain-containing protein [Caballeronia sp. NK8]
MNSKYSFEEGSIDLPEGFHDRSTNIFVYGSTTPSPLNLNIARDVLLPDEGLPAYVDRQMQLLKKNVRGHAVHQRTRATLGHADAAIEGEQITSTHKTGSQTIHQRQAAFIRSGSDVLIFSCSSVRPFDAKQDVLWTNWLTSFRARDAN